jgi:hypothetical protein
MQLLINKPIFVVGSPRSGTSILTWCLGQHPNVFPVPESNWLGQFAINVAISYEIGSARGDRSLLSGMDIGPQEFFANFGRAINELILAHREDLERKRKMTSLIARPKKTLGGWNARVFPPHLRPSQTISGGALCAHCARRHIGSPFDAEFPPAKWIPTRCQQTRSL